MTVFEELITSADGDVDLRQIQLGAGGNATIFLGRREGALVGLAIDPKGSSAISVSLKNSENRDLLGDDIGKSINAYTSYKEDALGGIFFATDLTLRCAGGDADEVVSVILTLALDRLADRE